MPNRTYYVRCKTGCLAEALTKEQTLAAIAQAMQTGEVKNVDAGFITRVKEQNADDTIFFWLGTTAEYNAIPEADRLENCLYIKTDDTFETDVVKTLLEFEETLNDNIAKIPPQAEITVNAIRGGEFTCVNEYGDIIEPKKKATTNWTFAIPEYGTYTITGVYNNITRTEAVKVDAVKKYEISMQFYYDNFAENDINTIVDVVNSVGVPETWHVGDEAPLPLTDGTQTVIRIIGKAHDTDTDGAKTKVTFACFGIASSMSDPNADSDDNETGWRDSYMRTVTVPATLEIFPECLKNAIRPVIKTTSAGHKISICFVTYDKLFLLSEVELTGTAAQSFEGEGEQYEYFKNGNNIYNVGPNEQTGWVWLRSPHKDSDYEYLQYRYLKSGSGVYRVQSSISASSYFGFCL